MFLYITVKYFFLNVKTHPASHSAPMETSECLIFSRILACLAVLGSIGKSNSPSIVDMIICTLGQFAFIIFDAYSTLFMWADTAIKLLVHPESVTEEFPCYIYFLTFFVGAQERLLHVCIFNTIVSVTNLGLLYYVFEYLPYLPFIFSPIHVPCYFENHPLDFLMWPPSCVPHCSSCMFRMCVCHWCCIYVTNNNSYCYVYFLSDLLSTVVIASCLVHMVALNCWFPPQRFLLLPRPLGCTIWIATIEFDLYVASTVWIG